MEGKLQYNNIMKVVNQIAFVPHYLDSHTFSRCSFSDVKFSLGVHTTEDKVCQKAFYIADLFKVDVRQEDKQALEFIYKSSECSWEVKKSNERTVALKICSNILQHICRAGEVILEKAGYTRSPIVTCS